LSGGAELHAFRRSSDEHYEFFNSVQHSGCAMHHCSICDHLVGVQRLFCPSCRVGFEGEFRLPRLARLDAAEQQLAEQFLLSGGNLKELAVALGTSYPTLRKRLDALIESLQRLRQQDEAEADRMLDRVEGGHARAEEAARLIREMSGGS
jgi:hypothetical protein